MQLLEKDPARRPADGLVLLRQLERIKAKLDRKQANETVLPGPFVTLKPELDPIVRHARIPTADGEGPATLASRLMRKELIELNKGGPIQRLFNHPLTLVLMLAACVGLIAWGLTRKKLSAEELYAAAEPLMQSDRPADWRHAWSDYLEPLTDRYPDNPHRDEIAAFHRKMQDVERQDKALKQAIDESPAIGGGTILPAGSGAPAKWQSGRGPADMARPGPIVRGRAR